MAVMAAEDARQAGDMPSRLSPDILPRLIDEINRVDRAAKRLSLNEKCDKCGQQLPPCTKSPSSFRNSWQSIKLNEDGDSPTIDTIQQGEEDDDAKPHRGLRFWLIIATLTSVAMIGALEGTIVGTALPSIVQDLGGAELYIWAVNGYFLTCMVVQPLYGQVANIFGRRVLMILAVSLFLIGSGISGAAHNMSTLIAGRAIQGSGGGPMTMLTHLILSDITTQRERGNFQSIIYASIAVGTGVGPFVGGIIIQRTSWRWIFLLNIPVAGLALFLVTVFLKVNWNKESSVREKLRRIDYIGNAIFIPSVVAILLALTYGGTIYPWTSWRVLLSMVIGFVGLAAFGLFERSKYCLEPTMPPRLFRNRTTVAAFALSFLNYGLLYWVIYFLPVYFQAVQRVSPSRSGVQLLPFVLVMIPTAGISGRILAKSGRYRIIHLVGSALMVLGCGLMTLLRPTSSAAAWVGYQTIFALGCGLLASTTLPAVQAPLAEKDTATATATWGFLRSFGMLWGVAMPATLFNNQIGHLSYRISDPAVRNLLSNGRAYEHATRAFVENFSGILKMEIISVYSDSLKLLWQVSIGVAGLGFLLVFVEKEITLRTHLKTDYGVTEKEKKANPQSKAEA